MIHYPLRKMKEAGVADVIVVTEPSSAGRFAEYLGSGARYGLRLAFRVQDEPGGVAQALALAEPFVAPGERLLVLLGYNLFEDSLGPYVRAFGEGKDKAFVFLKKVRDPRRYGVPAFRGDGRIAAVEEKPVRPRSEYGVTGIYLYDRSVFDVIRSIRPRNEASWKSRTSTIVTPSAASWDMRFCVAGGRMRARRNPGLKRICG